MPTSGRMIGRSHLQPSPAVRIHTLQILPDGLEAAVYLRSDVRIEFEPVTARENREGGQRPDGVLLLPARRDQPAELGALFRCHESDQEVLVLHGHPLKRSAFGCHHLRRLDLAELDALDPASLPVGDDRELIEVVFRVFFVRRQTAPEGCQDRPTLVPKALETAFHLHQVGVRAESVHDNQPDRRPREFI